MIVTPGYAKIGSKIYIDVQEFDPGSIINIVCFPPYENAPFLNQNIYINNFGSLANGEIVIQIFENWPRGEYRVFAQGFANKINKSITMKFIIE